MWGFVAVVGNPGGGAATGAGQDEQARCASYEGVKRGHTRTLSFDACPGPDIALDYMLERHDDIGIP